MRSELENLFRHSLVFLVGLVFQRAARFLLLPVYWSAFLPDEFGLLDLFEIFIQVMGLTFCFALPSAYIKFYRIDVKEGTTAESLRGTTFVLSFCGLVLLGFVMALCQGPLSWLFFKGRSAEIDRLYLIAGGAVVAFIASILMQNVLRAHGRAMMFVVLSTVQFALLMFFNIYFVKWLGMGIEGVLWSLILGWGGPALVYGLSTATGVRWRFDRNVARRLLRFALPLVPFGVISFFLMISGRLFLQHFHGRAEVGIFAAANRVALILMLVCVTPFQSAWGYLGLDYVKRSDAPAIFARAFSYLLVIGLAGFLVVSALGREMVLWFGRAHYLPALPHVDPLMAGYLMLLFFYWANAALVGSDRTLQILLNSLPPMAIALIGGWVAIRHPDYGIEAACAVFVLAMVVHAALTTMWGRRLVGFGLEKERVLKALAAFAIPYLVGQVLLWCVLPGWRGAIVLAEIGGFPLLLWAFGFLTEGEMARLHTLRRAVMGWRSA